VNKNHQHFVDSDNNNTKSDNMLREISSIRVSVTQKDKLILKNDYYVSDKYNLVYDGMKGCHFLVGP